MTPSAPPPRRSESERRRWLPWLASAAIHGAVLLWWASLPDAETEPDPEMPEFRPIELVELPPELLPVAIVPEPVEPEPEPIEPEPIEPEPSGEDATPPEPTQTPRRPRDRTPSSTPDPSTDEPEPTEPGTTDEPAKPGGVSLLGLRSSSRSRPSSGPVVRPSLPPPVGGQVVRRVGAERPSVVTPRDGKPRSLAEAGFKRRRGGRMVYRDAQTGFQATLSPDGRVKFRTTVKPSSMPGLAEALRSASGQELFHNAKRKLLEETFDLRLEMAIGFASDKIDRRLSSLYRELLERWSRDTPITERREELFERWDECEEGLAVELPGFEGSSNSELDAKRRAAGRKARQTIERFIRRQLPAGSDLAYPEAELRRLNARRHSRERFAPYR